MTKKHYRIATIPPNSPFAPMGSYHQRTSNLQVQKHRLIMAQHLGRCLNVDEIVHHKDGDIHNNDVENLELITRSQNSSLRKLTAYKLGYEEGYQQSLKDKQDSS